MPRRTDWLLMFLHPAFQHQPKRSLRAGMRLQVAAEKARSSLLPIRGSKTSAD